MSLPLEGAAGGRRKRSQRGLRAEIWSQLFFFSLPLEPTRWIGSIGEKGGEYSVPSFHATAALASEQHPDQTSLVNRRSEWTVPLRQRSSTQDTSVSVQTKAGDDHWFKSHMDDTLTLWLTVKHGKREPAPFLRNFFGHFQDSSKRGSCWVGILTTESHCEVVCFRGIGAPTAKLTLGTGFKKPSLVINYSKSSWPTCTHFQQLFKGF